MLKNGLSKSLMFILVFVLTLSTGLSTGVFAKSADNNKVNYCDDLEKLGDVSYQNFDGITKKVIKIKDTKKFGEISGMNVKPTGKITLVVPMVKSTPKLIDRTGPDVSILAAQYVNVKRESEACGTKKLEILVMHLLGVK